MEAKQNQDKNDRPPLVSILMPVYNEEKYVESCILSIISQDFSDWELIIVDDFSTDNSYSILGQCCSAEPRISIYKNDEKGIIPALRMAFSLARGKMVTRMDADDLMPAEKLGVLSRELGRLGSGNVVSGKVKYFSDSSLGEGFLKYEAWVNQQRYYEEIYKECTLPSACWMAFRSDLASMGAFVESHYPEDYDLLFRFYEKGLKIHGIDQVLHHWRDHPERASRNDPNYKDQNFFSLKLEYFMKLDRNHDVPLVVWGAGRTGKALIKELQRWYEQEDNSTRSKSLVWITANEKKIGHNIYGITVQVPSSIAAIPEKQVILAIKDASFQLEPWLSKLNIKEHQLFCFS